MASPILQIGPGASVVGAGVVRVLWVLVVVHGAVVTGLVGVAVVDGPSHEQVIVDPKQVGCVCQNLQ